VNSEQARELMFWRALADDLADVLINWGDEGYDFVTERRRALARYREARR
jgi:hypothetical protein